MQDTWEHVRIIAVSVYIHIWNKNISSSPLGPERWWVLVTARENLSIPPSFPKVLFDFSNSGFLRLYNWTKPVEVMEFQLSYFKSWKMMLWKCCTQYASKFGKLSSGHWKRSVFIPIPEKRNAKECSNYRTIALISHASKVMLKILQARLQQYLNQELSDVQAGFRKGRGTRDQIGNICWIIEKTIPEKHLLLLHWLL